MASNRKQVVMMGEEILLAELALQGHKYGYSIVCPKSKFQGLPDYCLQTASVPKKAVAAFELTNIDPEKKKLNLRFLERSLPPSTLLFSSAVTVTVSEQAHWIKNPKRLIGISAMPTLLSNHLIELSGSMDVSLHTFYLAQKFFISLGKEISIVQDRIGMVLPRILSMIINEAYFACLDEIAPPDHLDRAMELGTNYPLGPIAWSNRLTLSQVLAVLDALRKEYGEERYRVAPNLRQLARQYSF